MKYTVKSGDTLSNIALQTLGQASRFTEIAELNDIEDVNKLSLGQVLEIPTIALNVSQSSDKPDADEPMVGSEPLGKPYNMLSIEQFKSIVPGTGSNVLLDYVIHLNHLARVNQINTPLRASHFIAQVAHESSGFRVTKENLNYSDEGLLGTFGRYFENTEIALEYARDPEKIANRVYANRMGNGDEASGDGWKYVGRGLIQLTGKNNYIALGKYLELDLTDEPSVISDHPVYATMTATWYWTEHELNRYADEDNLEKITRIINGGLNGLEDRKAYLNRAKQVLGVAV